GELRPHEGQDARVALAVDPPGRVFQNSGRIPRLAHERDALEGLQDRPDPPERRQLPRLHREPPLTRDRVSERHFPCGTETTFTGYTELEFSTFSAPSASARAPRPSPCWRPSPRPPRPPERP